MSKYNVEDYENVQEQVPDYTDAEFDTDAGSESTGFTTGQTVALVGLAALGTAWVIEKAVKFGKWIGKTVEDYRESKKPRLVEKDKKIEPTDEEIREITGK